MMMAATRSSSAALLLCVAIAASLSGASNAVCTPGESAAAKPSSSCRTCGRKQAGRPERQFGRNRLFCVCFALSPTGAPWWPGLGRAQELRPDTEFPAASCWRHSCRRRRCRTAAASHPIWLLACMGWPPRNPNRQPTASHPLNRRVHEDSALLHWRRRLQQEQLCGYVPRFHPPTTTWPPACPPCLCMPHGNWC